MAGERNATGLPKYSYRSRTAQLPYAPAPYTPPSPYPGVTPGDMGRSNFAQNQRQSGYTNEANQSQDWIRRWKGEGFFQDDNSPAPVWSGWAGGGGGAGWASGGPPVPSVPPVADVDTSAAQAAAFARAKDRVGQLGAGALAGLRSSLGGRGLLGSGAEVRGAVDVVNRGQGELGDVVREQAIEQAALAERTAQANRQAALEQRRQNLADIEARNRLSFDAYEAQQRRRQDRRALSIDALAKLLSARPRF